MGALTLRRRLTLLVALTIVVPITAVGVSVVNLIGNEAEQRAFERVRVTSPAALGAVERTRADLQRAVDAMVTVGGLAQRIGAAGPASEASAFDEPFEDEVGTTMTAFDIDVLHIEDSNGENLITATIEPTFSGKVTPSSDAKSLVDDAERPWMITASAAGNGVRVQGGVWLDVPFLRSIASSDNVTIATIVDGKVAASTAPIGSPATVELVGEFSGRFGATNHVAIGTEIPGTTATLLVATRAASGPSQVSLLLILGGLLVVLVVLIVLVGHVVSGLVTGPVDILVGAALNVARGDLTQRVDVTGDKELVALGSAFNQMTDNLRQYVTQLQQSRTEFQAAIARLGDVLVSTHDLGGIIGVVLEAATLTIRAEVAVFFERVAMPARIRASAAHGGPVPELELNGTGVAGTAALHLAPVMFPGNEWLDLSEPVVASAIAVPVMSDGRLFGVLAAYGRVGASVFSQDDVETLQTLGRQAEVAIGNVMLHDETRRQARTDGLTGLWNRREFELRAHEQVREAERYGEPFGVVLVDIDDFKQVNDRFDHTTGDAALIWVAARLAEATRDSDIVARWGGEEFIIQLPRQGEDETAAVAERVRVAVSREPMVDGARIIPITVSIGLAVHPHDGAGADQLFKSADAALLRAKRLGKNRVEHASDDEGVA